jgi:hypothetical protein
MTGNRTPLIDFAEYPFSLITDRRFSKRRYLNTISLYTIEYNIIESRLSRPQSNDSATSGSLWRRTARPNARRAVAALGAVCSVTATAMARSRRGASYYDINWDAG